MDKRGVQECVRRIEDCIETSPWKLGSFGREPGGLSIAVRPREGNNWRERVMGLAAGYGFVRP